MAAANPNMIEEVNEEAANVGNAAETRAEQVVANQRERNRNARVRGGRGRGGRGRGARGRGSRRSRGGRRNRRGRRGSPSTSGSSGSIGGPTISSGSSSSSGQPVPNISQRSARNGSRVLREIPDPANYRSPRNWELDYNEEDLVIDAYPAMSAERQARLRGSGEPINPSEVIDYLLRRN